MKNKSNFYEIMSAIVVIIVAICGLVINLLIKVL